ncbi:YheC/YheD family endospore coat-associated protein [Alicyclobacillus mengziensis]|uniref:YheC/YheD family protein n=1 Tax=Alicyclobacillus mengziensis TaxID=2931921 RepID=A0A9X7VUM0_9BACL|nr:YheC/YheD family protein [Alicyclobacillus mengziensis]QSO45416.1 YheC/YheD family protein [Alicyclobacillus mengziensis]
MAEGSVIAMSETDSAQLVWIRDGGRIRVVLYTSTGLKRDINSKAATVRLSNLRLPWVTSLPTKKIVYRHPTHLKQHGTDVVAGPVFAILAGNRHFTGSRADFRDMLETGKAGGEFVYVLPTECVTEGKTWTGYVRIGYQKWIPIPCPLPEAVYNRIPNRVLERIKPALAAKRQLEHFGIPMFNPDYFSKAETYDVLRHAGLGHYLPRTLDLMTWSGFSAMLRQSRGVYLKPTHSSVGHGIMRVDRSGSEWRVRVLKNLKHSEYHAHSLDAAWKLVQQNRIPGKYVIQRAISLVEWEGKPCDLRVLLQKQGRGWHVVGKGVRVAGAKSITTHVPAGGSIVALSELLARSFPDRAKDVEEKVESLALSCAEAIDAHYNGQLGEMSMDIGIDKDGKGWLFEANSKPMKFDEPQIREHSLRGVLRHLTELRRGPEVR